MWVGVFMWLLQTTIFRLDYFCIRCLDRDSGFNVRVAKSVTYIGRAEETEGFLYTRDTWNTTRYPQHSRKTNSFSCSPQLNTQTASKRLKSICIRANLQQRVGYLKLN